MAVKSSIFLAVMLSIAGCRNRQEEPISSDITNSLLSSEAVSPEQEEISPAQESILSEPEEQDGSLSSPSETDEALAEEELILSLPESEMLSWDETWEYAEYSAIHTDTATLYYSQVSERKDKIICINAGHGTSGGSSKMTLCHPDGSAKVTGGSTAKGATEAVCVSSGTTMKDGTPEADVTLMLALVVKDCLLENGYDVLMVRENDNTQLDNIARTVIANTYADCHISLHYDSTETDKGLFYISVPDVASYRAMEPVASMWEEHIRLGEALLTGMTAQDVKIYGSGAMAIDLTQTSYSTIPSVDLEVGDRASDYSDAQLQKLAAGISLGLDAFFSTEAG